MTAPVANAPKSSACGKCGRAHEPQPDCPVVADYHDAPFLKKYGS